MRKAVILLSISTLLFAALSAYLTVELHSRAPAVQSAGGASRPPDPSFGPPAGAEPAFVANVQTVPDAGTDPGRMQFDRAQAHAQAQAEYLAQLRRDLADPVKRAAMVELSRKTLRSQDPRLAEYLGMKEQDFDEFLTLLADQGLQYQEWFQDCQKRHCVWNEDFPAFEARKRRAIDDLLGPELSQRYTQYDQSRAERMTVGNFRRDLPDAIRMNDEQSERLIAALADERQKFEREVKSRGLEASAFGAGHGVVYWDSSHRSVEERVAAGREYSERLRTRAADVLSASQLREYTRIQESELASMESTLPYHDSLNTAGLPSGIQSK